MLIQRILHFQRRCFAGIDEHGGSFQRIRDDILEQRVMSAPQHEGVNFFLRERKTDILSQSFLSPCGQTHPSSTSGTKSGHGRLKTEMLSSICRMAFAYALLEIVPIVPITPILFFLRRGCCRFCTGDNNTDNRKSSHVFAQHQVRPPKRCCRRPTIIFTFFERRNSVSSSCVLADDLRRFRSVGNASRVAEIDDIFLRQSGTTVRERPSSPPIPESKNTDRFAGHSHYWDDNCMLMS